MTKTEPEDTLRRAAALLAGDAKNAALRATFTQRADDLAAGRSVPGLNHVLGEANTIILLLGD